MGTRSTITFTEKFRDQETPLVSIYQQYDGYIKGVGHDLARWLLKKKLINGIGFEDKNDGSVANGVGCLAAQFIRDNKLEVGGLYITSPYETEDYNYNVIINDALTGSLDDITTIRVTQFDEEEPIFIGTPNELLNFNEEWED